MKKFVIYIAVFLLIGNLMFANSTTRKSRDRDIKARNFTILANSGDYTLVRNSNGTFFLYNENWLTDDVYLYAEEEKVTRESVVEKLNSASSSSKVIDNRNGYTVYSIDASLFSKSYYVVHTPNDNFYSISIRIKKIHADGTNLAGELGGTGSGRSESPLDESYPLEYKQGYLADMTSSEFRQLDTYSSDSSYDEGNKMLKYLYDEANPYTRDRIINFICQYVSEPLYAKKVSSNDNLIAVRRAWELHHATWEVDNKEVWYCVYYDGSNVYLILSFLDDSEWTAAHSYVYNIH